MTGPMHEFDARRYAKGIAATDVTTKQRVGREMAERLGFDAGPAGADGGVDGRLARGDVRALFFCRLNTPPLGVADARAFAAVLLRDRATHGVALAAFSGFAPTFEPELLAILDGADRYVTLHLLRLQDVIAETAAFHALRLDLG